MKSYFILEERTSIKRVNMEIEATTFEDVDFYAESFCCEGLTFAIIEHEKEHKPELTHRMKGLWVEEITEEDFKTYMS